MPACRVGDEFALLAPGVVDQAGLLQARQDLVAGIDASAQWMHSIWNGDLRMSMPMGQTRTHFLHSMHCVGLVAVVDQQRVAVAEHALQIAVGADGGAEALAHEA